MPLRASVRLGEYCMKRLLIFSLCLLLLLLAGCSAGTCEEDKLQSYTIADHMAMVVGQTASLPLASTSGNSDVHLSQEGIVSVENGTIRALSAGTVQITARVECLETTLDVVVYDELLEITIDNDNSKGSVTVRSEGDLLPGKEVTLRFTPMRGFAVNAVTLNGKAVTVVDNQVTFTIEENTAVAVTYKEVSINILINNNSSATMTINGEAFAFGEVTKQYQLGEVLNITVSHTKTDLIPTVKIGGRTVVLNDRTRPVYNFQHTVTEDTEIYLEVSYYTYRGSNAEMSARRQTVMDAINELTNAYYYYSTNINVLDVDADRFPGYVLKNDVIYRGIPYNQGITSASAYKTIVNSVSNGVNIVDTTQFVGKWYFLYGASCSSVPYWSWSTISKSISFVDATTMTPSHGCWRVGDYTATYTTTAAGHESYADTYADCEKNGTTVMYNAYALLQPGDAATHFKPGATTGHAIVFTDVKVVKNSNGSINGTSSYVIYSDTHGTASDTKTTYTMGGKSYPVYSSCTVNTKMTFQQLFNNGYLPVTCKELLTGQETLESFSVTDSKKGGLVKSSVLTGTLTSNHNISHVTLTITDHDGNVVQDAIRYWQTDVFSMTYFADRFSHNGWSSSTGENYKLYTADNVIDLSTLTTGVYGCKVVAYNGNGESYVVRDFRFLV